MPSPRRRTARLVSTRAARARGSKASKGTKGSGKGVEGVGDGHNEGHAHTPDAPVCAACLQPIDLTHRAHVLDRLKRDAETTAREHRRLLQSLRAAESEAVKAEQRRRDEMAAANRARADASARAAAAANRARDAQARLRAVRDARVNAHVVAAAMARAEALVAASPVAPVQVPTPSDANNLSGLTTDIRPGHCPQHTTRRADSGNAPALALVAAVETAVSDAERAFRQLETRAGPVKRGGDGDGESARYGSRLAPIAGGCRGGRARGAARGGGRGGGGARHGATRGLRVRDEGYSELPLRGRARRAQRQGWRLHGGAHRRRARHGADPPPSVNPAAGRRDGDDADRRRRATREARTPRTRTGLTNEAPPLSPPPRRLKK